MQRDAAGGDAYPLNVKLGRKLTADWYGKVLAELLGPIDGLFEYALVASSKCAASRALRWWSNPKVS